MTWILEIHSKWCFLKSAQVPWTYFLPIVTESFVRVKFREDKYREKIEDKRRMEEEREIEKEKQEKRLEALREQVRPQV